MLTKNELERERYESRLKRQRDELSRVMSAKEEGLLEGREEGKKALAAVIQSHQRILGRVLSSMEELQNASMETLRKMQQELDDNLAALLASLRASKNTNPEKN